MKLLEQIKSENCPHHVAIIMDGNGRWAKSRAKSRLYGHSQGVEAIRDVLKAATELKIEYLTLYAFSTENWNRPKKEVDGLMDLMVLTISNEVDELNKNNVRLGSIGDRLGLPESCQSALDKAIADTAKNTGINLIVALNYSARWEILNAVKKIAQKIENKEMTTDEVNTETFEQELCLASIPDPDLLIRTSGECRISNFMLWQLAYSELYFTEKLWPDFGREDLYKAIINYQSRERRFGMVSEQLNP